MRKTAAFLMVVVATLLLFHLKGAAIAAQPSRTFHVENEPGALETFLLSTANASVKCQELGTLPAPADAMVKFSAIVAEDPLSKKKAKGLKVELKNGDQSDAVHLDEEGLKEFQEYLASQQEKHLDRYSPAELEKPYVNSAVNRSTANGELYVGLDLGFYRHERAFGLFLHAPWGTRHHTVVLYLPNATISQAIDLVAAGRAFLQGN